jgi:CarD family transcriptional regulator
MVCLAFLKCPEEREMAIEETFVVGDKVVYPMHGVGQIQAIVTQIIERQPQHFYQIAMEGKGRGEVLVPVTDAKALGLRFVLKAPDVKEVLNCLQQAPQRAPSYGHTTAHYAWCKKRLRQGDALGLAEVRRFLHDFEQLESLREFKFRKLRNYVCAQLAAEVAEALHCTEEDAVRLVEAALTSKRPVHLSPGVVHHEP